MGTTTSTAEKTTGVDQHGNRWTGVAVGAAVALASWALLLQVLVGHVIPPVLILGIAFVAFVPLLLVLRRRWPGLALAVTAVLAVAGDIEIVVSDLSHPEDGAVFTLTVTAVIAAVVAVVAGLAIWFRWPTGAVRGVVGSAMVVVVVAGLVGLVASSAVESVGAAPGDILVQTRAFAFGPTDLTVTAGGGIWVDNADPFRHTFTVPGTGVDLELPGSTSRRIDVDLSPGVYEVICAIPGHESMTATLVVDG